MSNNKAIIDQFADINILRYRVPHFEELTLREKRLIYHLSEAAKWGRDILFDQNFKYNLLIRETLESIYKAYDGVRDTTEWR
ncbi:MAG: dihydrofolate reductase, partial [Rikenellaceae bacterium]